MSYILDALRKAEAERQRGAVPDLHAQTVAATSLATPSPRRAALPRWLAAVLLSAIVAGAVGWWARRDVPPRVATATPASVPVPVPVPAPAAAAAPAAVEPGAGAGSAAPSAAQAALAAATPAPALRTTPPAAPAVIAQGAAATQPAAANQEVDGRKAVNARNDASARKDASAKRDVSTKRDASARKDASVKAMQPRSKPERAAPAASPPSAARLPALAELPAALRQQVPALAIGGSVYSAQPSARLLIVNGQVLHEGASLAPRLTIEHIRPKSAVFSIDGTHFELPM